MGEIGGGRAGIVTATRAGTVMADGATAIVISAWRCIYIYINLHIYDMMTGRFFLYIWENYDTYVWRYEDCR